MCGANAGSYFCGKVMRPPIHWPRIFLHALKERSLALSDELINMPDWLICIFVDELTDTGEDVFVSSIVTKLRQEVVRTISAIARWYRSPSSNFATGVSISLLNGELLENVTVGQTSIMSLSSHTRSWGSDTARVSNGPAIWRRSISSRNWAAVMFSRMGKLCVLPDSVSTKINWRICLTTPFSISRLTSAPNSRSNVENSYAALGHCLSQTD